MSILKGNDLILFIDEGATKVVLARATSCDLEQTQEELEITSKSSGDYKEVINGRKEWSVSTGGLVEFTDVDGFIRLQNAYDSGASIDIVIGVATKDTDTTPLDLDATAHSYSGAVKISSLSLNTGNAGELTTYSASLSGTGQLSFTTPA